MRNHIRTLLIILVAVVGIAVMLYPTLSNYINQRTITTAIQEFTRVVASSSADRIEAQWQSAREYNEGIASGAIGNPFGGEVAGVVMDDELYYSQLDISGVMGYIEIDKIDVKLPIYHGTEEETLAKGVGHMQGTSLPVGGENTNAVLTGHRGLESAVLFTDLDKLEIGDEFYIHLLDATLTYEVDYIETVEPYYTALLEVIPGEDYVTLMTCTPYGVNSHRLIVRARHTGTQRMTKDEYIDQFIAEEPDDPWNPAVIYIPAATALLIVLVLIEMNRRSSKLKKSKRWIDSL